MLIFVFGFSMGFYFLVDETEFSSPYMAAFTLYRGLVGDFDYKMFDGADGNIVILAYVAFSVYLVVALIVMFNLLIGAFASSQPAM